MTYYLGISAYHAGSSACIFKDGEIICAIEEERLNRVKNWAGFPMLSIKECIKEAKIDISDINYITINSNPTSNIGMKFKKFLLSNDKEKLIKNYLKRFYKKNYIKNTLEKEFKKKIKAQIIKVDHHLSHIFSSYYLSGFKNAVGLSIDGLGDFVSLCIVEFQNGKNVKVLHKEYYPNSLGFFYEGITQFLGFRAYGDEYKVMGLSAYGKPIYKDLLEKLFLNKNSIMLNQYYLNDLLSKQSKLMGKPKSPIILNEKFKKIFRDVKHKNKFKEDLACSAQALYEEKFKLILKKCSELSSFKNIAISGGCALNSLANGSVLKNTTYKKHFIPYMPGDNGGSIGSCLYQISKDGKNINKNKLSSPYQGPKIKENEEIKIIKIFEKSNKIIKFKSNKNLAKFIAKEILKKKIIALCQDRMEFGPRALGNRSIICSPSLKNAKDILNKKIKLRENFRPFAPSILEDHVSRWFVCNKKIQSPYMSYVYEIKKNKRKLIPAVCHIDGSGRLQTVTKLMNEMYYDIINEFYKISKIPIILNTSFNINEPIVNSPIQALKTFKRSKMDYLIINKIVIKK